MTAIDTTFLKTGAAIASPADYPDSQFSQALRQPVLPHKSAVEAWNCMPLPLFFIFIYANLIVFTTLNL
ncbi:hypothetical protein [uncultured Nostoc sp.]|uniref:hypothetical protein n=1 Tax=uncultured Nostoc sp. TaxID=340711 RepID=UPI0026254A86|nr:hypothetical protein [uncultured Nostoc sp.]